MKKLPWAAALLLAHAATAQNSQPIKPEAGTSVGDSKFFIKLYGSYGLATPGSYRSFDFSNGPTILYGGFTAAPSGTNVRYQATSAGLGQGLRVGGGLGFVISDFINLGVDVDYYMSGKIRVLGIESSTFTGSPPPNNTVSTLASSDIEATMISVMPNITFKALAQPSYYIYTRLGIGAGLPNVKQDYVNLRNNVLASSQNFSFKGSIAWGYMVSLGIQMRLTPKLRFFGEAQAINFSYAPVSRSVTAWLDDAKYTGGNVTTPPVDVLTGTARTTSQKEVNYFDDFTVVPLTTPVQREAAAKLPAQAVRLTIPIASLGLQIGLAYRF